MEDIVEVPINEVRAASTAGGGTALSTTAAFIAFPTGTDYLEICARNFVTGVVLQYAFNPYLAVIKGTGNLLQDPANVTNGSENMQDGDTSTALTFNTFASYANGSVLYVGAHVPFRGVRVIIGNANSNNSVLTVKYWKNDSTWADITATDGTINALATFGQTGNVTWTVPTTWQKASLRSDLNAANKGIGDTTLTGSIYQMPLYWTRWETNNTWAASVSATGMLAMNRSTAYAERPQGVFFEQRIKKAVGGIGCVEALVDAGTGNLIVNAGSTRADSSLA